MAKGRDASKSSSSVRMSMMIGACPAMIFWCSCSTDIVCIMDSVRSASFQFGLCRFVGC